MNSDAAGLSVMGNLFGANRVAIAPPVRVIGELSGSTLVGNSFVNTAGVLYAGSLGYRNYVDRRGAGPNQHELTAVKNGALVVRSTTTPPSAPTRSVASSPPRNRPSARGRG